MLRHIDRAQAEDELDVAVDETVAPLLRAIGESFALLMVQNAAAYERERAAIAYRLTSIELRL